MDPVKLTTSRTGGGRMLSVVKWDEPFTVYNAQTEEDQSSGDEEHVSAFLAQQRTGTVTVADWGHILLSGWGEDMPQDIEGKVYNWTFV